MSSIGGVLASLGLPGLSYWDWLHSVCQTLEPWGQGVSWVLGCQAWILRSTCEQVLDP